MFGATAFAVATFISNLRMTGIIMLIKQKDSLDQSIQQLETIAPRNDLPRHIRERVQMELRTLKAGMRGEKDAAYFINFDFAESKNWAVIHDLRIVHQGLVAQIDHLLVSRFLEFYVLESKSFSTGIKITEQGEFLVEYNSGHVAIESPIEQNRRHGLVLWKVLQNSGLLPIRLGITLQPRIFSYVLVSPKSVVKRPPKKNFNTDMVIKSDVLLKNIEAADEKASTLAVAGSFAKMVSSETLEQIARGLVTLHQPATANYFEKFGIAPFAPNNPSPILPTPIEEKEIVQSHAAGYYCFKCKQPITKRVAQFCFDNKKRFGGRAYCFNCQKLF